MSSDTIFTIEFAKSGRSACKKCKAKIEKGAMRIGKHSKVNEITMTEWKHPQCFSMPRKMTTGPEQMTAQDFCRDILQDSTGGQILPSKAEEIAALLEEKKPKASPKKADKTTGLLAEIQADFKAKEGDEPPAKKAKDLRGRQVAAYGKYHKLKVPELKDILRWNHQVMVGTKDHLLLKVVDGEVYGRLTRCQLCTGKLKLLEDGVTVVCGGNFDEDSHQRIDCSYSVPAWDAPRWQPWFSEHPTKEEEEKMESLIAEAKGEDAPLSASSDSDLAKMIKAANKLAWNLSGRDGIRAAVSGLLDILRSAGEKTVALPDDETTALHSITGIITLNQDKPVAEIVPLIVQQYGYVETKQKATAKQLEALEQSIKNPKNAALVHAFHELGTLYFKEKNKNAGPAIMRVVKALSELDFEVTEENALGLGKGKTKIPNIGKSSAEKIYEFVTAGRIEKLDEKRAVVNKH